ncbi:MAG TPA: hypothetical protein VFM71_10280 [Gemmatimonadaceae bacterium]|nr:hypothetical protein [Gemmatimonadaceae bacterium]
MQPNNTAATPTAVQARNLRALEHAQFNDRAAVAGVVAATLAA